MRQPEQEDTLTILLAEFMHITPANVEETSCIYMKIMADTLKDSVLM